MIKTETKTIAASKLLKVMSPDTTAANTATVNAEYKASMAGLGFFNIANMNLELTIR